MAGYSGTPLPKKLGIKAGHVVALINAPPDFEALLPDLPDDVTLTRTLKAHARFDVLVCFASDSKQLRRYYHACRQKLDPAGGLWVCWPKKASGVVTDLDENDVQSLGLDTGLVDNKVCAIDATWSGLRFVVRLQDRPKK